MLEQRLQRETAGAETGGVAAAIAPALRSVAHGAFTRLPVAIRLWDGSCLGAGTSREAPTLEIRSPRALQYLLSAPGELGLGRAWVAGDLEIDGDIESLLSWRRRYRDVKLSALDRLRILRTATAVAGRSILRPAPKLAAEAHPHGRVHSLRRDRAAISHHYDVSNDFYGIVLGPSMVYSCAYFESPDDTLEAAQTRKLDLICRKLALRPGDQLLDIGCGWGSLIIHAARNYGVTALGITLSAQQAQLAQQRIAQAGLQDSCEVRVCDYRELTSHQFDAIASVGMYEHVGRDQMGVYVRTVRDLLKPGGAFLNHGITRLTPGADRRRTFINRFVFPDGELHPLTNVLAEMYEAGLEVRDVESLREHYALTLRHWVQNLERDYEAAVQDAGEERARIWRLYMSGSAEAFAGGDISVFQTLAVKGGAEHRLPLDRAELIAADAT